MRELGTGKWSAGPTGVIVLTQGNIVAGVLANNVWSFAGQLTRTVVCTVRKESLGKAVNQLLMQPFFNYNLPDGWFLVTAPILTADWEASSGDRWTIPVGGGFGRVFKIGSQPVNANIQGYYHVERPTEAASWHLTAELHASVSGLGVGYWVAQLRAIRSAMPWHLRVRWHTVWMLLALFDRDARQQVWQKLGA